MPIGSGYKNGFDADSRSPGQDARGTIQDARGPISPVGTASDGGLAAGLNYQAAQSQAFRVPISIDDLEAAFTTHRQERSELWSAMGGGDSGDLVYVEGGRHPHGLARIGQIIWVRGAPVVLMIAAFMLLFMTSWNIVLNWH